MNVFSEDGVHGHLSGEIMVIDNGIFPVQYTGKLTWNGVPYVDIDTRYPTHKRNIGEWIRYCVSQIQERRKGSASGTFLPANASGLDGILYLQMKFCEFWSYERVMGVHDMNEVEGIPCIGVEKEYTMASYGQLRTRFQAFVESIEIKKLQGGKM